LLRPYQNGTVGGPTISGRNPDQRRKLGLITMDMKFWEQKYGRKLTDAEKLEVECNLRDLLRTIKEVRDSKPQYFEGFLDGVRRPEIKSATSNPQSNL
jgi:hypothetical protein